MAVNPIPDGYHSITPYLILSNAAQGLSAPLSYFA